VKEGQGGKAEEETDHGAKEADVDEGVEVTDD